LKEIEKEVKAAQEQTATEEKINKALETQVQENELIAKKEQEISLTEEKAAIEKSGSILLEKVATATTSSEESLKIEKAAETELQKQGIVIPTEPIVDPKSKEEIVGNVVEKNLTYIEVASQVNEAEKKVAEAQTQAQLLMLEPGNEAKVAEILATADATLTEAKVELEKAWSEVQASQELAKTITLEPAVQAVVNNLVQSATVVQRDTLQLLSEEKKVVTASTAEQVSYQAGVTLTNLTVAQIEQAIPNPSVKVIAFFAWDSAVLTDQYKNGLQKLAGGQFTTLTIAGFVQESGNTNAHNLNLSNRRALAVRDYLESLGVSAEQIQILAAGIYDNKPDGRRVEVVTS